MKKASEYRRHAAECRQMIGSATTDEQKAMLENMAKTWDALADDRKRRLMQSQRIAELEAPKENGTRAPDAG